MINLLPPQQKEEILLDEQKKLVIILGILVSLFLLSLILILLTIKIYLASELQIQRTSPDLEKGIEEDPKMKEIEDKVKAANQKISQIDNFYQKQIFLSEILVKIQKTTPASIYLTNFSFSKEDSQITISGFSPNRETLVQLRKNLEENFQEVKVPPVNWVEPLNINFSGINFKIGQPR